MQRGHTLCELLVALAVAATLALVAVPGLAWVQGRSAVRADAQCLALVLRSAQARAAATGDTVCVRLVGQGKGYVCEQSGAAVTTVVASGTFGAPCSTNYPGAAVEFHEPGWPCSLSGEPRAGSFTFACDGAQVSVILQMGGRVRWG
jgi:prepilin-type N-terminal cleavage/methylation domain-containing protein